MSNELFFKTLDSLSETIDIKGNEKIFRFCGNEIRIQPGLDEFNSYRIVFRKIACDCEKCARELFDERVQDLDSYVQFAPQIYNYYLDKIIEKCVGILLSKGIYTISQQDFKKAYTDDFHLVPDDFAVTHKSIELTIQNNQRQTAGLLSYVPHLIGGGFGFRGALSGITKAVAYNSVRDAVADSMIQGAAKIKSKQKDELYNRIKKDVLFDHYFLDYWRAYLTMTDVLNQNGSHILFPTGDSTQTANSIFLNLSNPGFPDEKKAEAMTEILQLSPYNKKYHSYLETHFGNTAEVKALKDYFGYIDLDDPRTL